MKSAFALSAALASLAVADEKADYYLLYGSQTAPVDTHTVEMNISQELETLTIDFKQQVKLLKGLVNNELEQMFACHRIKTLEWYCYWTTVTFDGIEYTLTNYIYTK